MRVLCAAMLRIKDEARWIAEVIESIYPLCHRIFVLDDNSTDDTLAICRRYPNVIALASPFSTLDESRDKSFLYDLILDYPDYIADDSGYRWPRWILAIDGDEVLDFRDRSLLYHLMTKSPDDILAYKFRIIYLWNSRTTKRVDGVYGKFARPSLFRVINPAFRFQSTPWGNGANFHCSSIPQELLHRAEWSEVRLNHLGYMLPEDRLRKFAWYSKIDPDNPSEDGYRHILQGLTPEVPADMKLMHAGPLRTEPVE